MAEFLEWKSEMEKKSISKYIKRNKANVKDGLTHHYICHRSGQYSTEGEGKRHLKIKGSNKIGGYCPAKITVEEKVDGRIFVSHINTHFGHGNDLGRLTLSAERQLIAMKISENIPFDNILDEVRDSVTSSGIERKHLLTKKDLNNIEQSFNLRCHERKHENDVESVRIWVSELNDEESKPFAFFKGLGQENVEKGLEKNDYILIIMTDAQSEILKKFGGDCICVDGTHGTNQYGFQLFTIMVLYDLREGFPCAFLISNRSDESILSLYFSHHY